MRFALAAPDLTARLVDIESVSGPSGSIDAVRSRAILCVKAAKRAAEGGAL